MRIWFIFLFLRAVVNIPIQTPLIFRHDCYFVRWSSHRWVVDNRAILQYAQARRICQLKNQINFWNRLTCLNKHLIFLRSLKEPFGGNSVKIFDSRAFGLFKTVPGCRGFANDDFISSKVIRTQTEQFLYWFSWTLNFFAP